MLHINDDSDELFRKAAEHYPLNTGQGDWEGLRKKMEEGIAETPSELPPDRKRQGWFFIVLAGLLLMAPLAIMDNYLQKQNNATATLASPGERTGSIEKQEPNNPASRSGEASQLPESTQPGPNTASATTDLFPVPNYNHKREETRQMIPRVSVNRTTSQDDPAGNRGRNKMLNDKEKMKFRVTPGEQEQTIIVAEPLGQASPVSPSNIVPAAPVTAVTEVPKKPVPDNADPKDAVTEKQKDPAKPEKNRERHFYAGIIAGPDLSMVKFQSAKKIGYSAGIIMGYKASKRWGLETGLLWDRKAYYTDGKYFSTKNIPLPNYTTIREADGVCRMFEIPVNIRYNFKIKPRSNWFVSAGSSSYIMKRETYDYEVKRYNNIYYGSAEYKNSGSSFFSVINASAGYQMKLGTIGDIRFEPYIKVPVNKVGIGNLPLQSGGILVGLTKTF